MAAEITKETGNQVQLIRGRGGVFKVRVEDSIVAEKTMMGFPTTEEVVKAVQQQLSS